MSADRMRFQVWVHLPELSLSHPAPVDKKQIKINQPVSLTCGNELKILNLKLAGKKIYINIRFWKVLVRESSETNIKAANILE